MNFRVTPQDSTIIRKIHFPWRIVWVEILLVSAALGAGGLFARNLLREHFVHQVQTQALDTLKALSVDLPQKLPPDWCASHAAGTGFRLTAIARDGQVVCDSERDASTMENHAERPEILQAMAQAFGESERHSATLNLDMLYTAVRVRNGDLVLREAIPLLALAQTFWVDDLSLFTLLAAFALVFALVIFWAGKSFSSPMQRILQKASGEDPRTWLEQSALNPGGEWSDLELALDRIQSDLIQKTEQLSREREELATLMSAISDAIFAVDLEGSPLFFNSRFALLFGGKDFQERKPRLGEIFRAPEILKAYQGVFTEGRTQNVSVSLHMAGNSVTHDFTLAVAPLHRADATVYGAVGIFHDVTELKRAEKIRIDFVANVSHELRTPLTAIKGYADTLKEDVAQKRFDSSEKFLEIILKNVDRLMSLIRDLLELSWLESSPSEEGIAKSPISTRELTERALVQLEKRRAEKNHRIETSFGAASVNGDPARAEQVVVNLLENAIKYTPASGRISVRWESVPGAVRLQVSDNGPGIAPEHYPRLFERFYRVDQARSRDVGGTGLGLAIVKHIMQRHGGSISVSGEPGGGTTFTCLFPLK
jgi:two-component system phosphate regulon sensor histidine kinase PhoR